MARQTIAGVDVSTKSIAVVILDASTGDLVRWDEWFFPAKHKLPGKNSAERCRWPILHNYALFVAGVRALQIEQPMGSSIKSVAEVERVCGAVICSTPKSVHVNPPIGPSEWKSQAGLKGNASKEEIAAHAVLIYPLLEGDTQDIHDASMIGRAMYLETSRASS